MFGESESESPRVPSPWDSLIHTSTPPSPTSLPHPTTNTPTGDTIPKLVPEAEEGNVEYKLQLLWPSPARFARLVTQLRWRLLEGGGQAYYELGVADSGALVGLHRHDLEQSLETLEMMAGEIGASVIIVKEIEVPASMAGLAGSETDHWNRKRRRKREVAAGLLGSASESESSATERDVDAELSMTDLTDYDEDTNGNPEGVMPLVRSKSANSLLPDNLEVEFRPSSLPNPSPLSTDLEISSVYKPRPMRQRDSRLSQTPVRPNKAAKRALGFKKVPLPGDPASAAATLDDHGESNMNKQTKQQTRRRQTRDRKREEKRKTLLATVDSNSNLNYNSTSTSIDAAVQPNEPITASVESIPAFLGNELASLHVSIEPTTTNSSTITTTTTTTTTSASNQSIPAILEILVSDEEIDDLDVFGSITTVKPKPLTNGTRLIVEALVVRKLSLEEAFLDFGGFALR